MNTSTQIETLLKGGVLNLTIGLSPNKLIFVQAKQTVKTGPQATLMEIGHQAEDESLAVCLNQIARQVEHSNNLKPSKLVTLPRGGSN